MLEIKNCVVAQGLKRIGDYLKSSLRREYVVLLCILLESPLITHKSQQSLQVSTEFFSWLANVTGGIAIGVEQIDDLTDIIKGMAAKDAGKMEELEEEIAKIALKPIPALQVIKQKHKEIENKKKVLGITYKK